MVVYVVMRRRKGEGPERTACTQVLINVTNVTGSRSEPRSKSCALMELAGNSCVHDCDRASAPAERTPDATRFEPR